MLLTKGIAPLSLKTVPCKEIHRDIPGHPPNPLTTTTVHLSHLMPDKRRCEVFHNPFRKQLRLEIGNDVINHVALGVLAPQESWR